MDHTKLCWIGPSTNGLIGRSAAQERWYNMWFATATPLEREMAQIQENRLREILNFERVNNARVLAEVNETMDLYLLTFTLTD